MSYLRERRVNHDKESILIGVALSRRTSVGTRRLIRMPPGGVILFEFQINADQ